MADENQRNSRGGVASIIGEGGLGDLDPELLKRLLTIAAAQRMLADQESPDPFRDPQVASAPFRGDLRQAQQTRAQGVPFIQLGAPPTGAEKTGGRIAAGSAALTNILTSLNKARRQREAKANAKPPAGGTP